MMWRRESLNKVAPSETSNIRLVPTDEVWHLTLDQIESNTGHIVNKKMSPVSDAGNSTYIFDQENVLYSKLRPYLNKVICPTEAGFATTELVPLKPNPEVLNRKYLTYYLSSKQFLSFANVAVAGVKMPRIIMSKFWQHKIPLPPPSEQQRIVEILDQADELRKKRTEADAKAARILHALFYKMFGDPVTNPKGWPVYNLGDPQIAKINPRLKKQEVSIDAEFSFVPMPEVDEKWGRITGKQTRPYSEVCRGFTHFQDGDVIFAKITPCMQNGKAAIVSNLKNGRGFGSTEFHVFRPGIFATPEWLFGLIRLNMFRKQAEASFTGSAGQQRVPLYFLKNYKIGCPPKELQQRFASSAHRIFQHVDEIETSENKLLQLFKWLLHSAFTGDLTATWREAHMKELLAEMKAQTKVLAAHQMTRKELKCNKRLSKNLEAK